VNIAHNSTKDLVPNLHETSQASADYSQEASTDPATHLVTHAYSLYPATKPTSNLALTHANPHSTFQEASACPANTQDDDRKTSCDHPIMVSLAVEFVHKFSQQLYKPPRNVYAVKVQAQEYIQNRMTE
jgi:hypothetical protein